MDKNASWMWGIMFTLILGSYGYAYLVSASAIEAAIQAENRVTRQLDLIERKLDRLIDQQYNFEKRGR